MKYVSCLWVVAAAGLAGCAATTQTVGANGTGGPVIAPATRLEVAQIAEQSGNPAAALRIYQAAAAAAPHDVDAQVAYSRALLRSGDIVGARDVLLRAAAQNPGVRSLPRELAVVDTLSGAPGRAIGEFDALLASDPHDWKTMVDKGVALDLQGNHDAAQALYRQAMPLAKGAPAVATDYAVSLMLQGKFADAKAILAPYFNRYDAPDRTRVDLAIAAKGVGDAAMARELLGAGQDPAQVEALVSALAAREQPVAAPPPATAPVAKDGGHA